MKYHALFVIFEKASKFEIVVCCILQVALYGLIFFFKKENSQILSASNSLDPIGMIWFKLFAKMIFQHLLLTFCHFFLLVLAAPRFKMIRNIH